MPLELCRRLVRCQSITPRDDGVMQVLVDYLKHLGFTCKLFAEKEPYNLFAEYNFRPGATLGFLGHVDVVPAGSNWSCDPFEGHINDSAELVARGIADMKGAIACYIKAIEDCIAHNPNISLALYITGDEEVGSCDGAQSLIAWAKQNDLLPSACIIGEPSSCDKIGDRVYVGHRGSCNINVTTYGTQRHVAYAMTQSNGIKDNAIAKLCLFLHALHKHHFDEPIYPEFARTNLEATIITSANYATNVIPEYAHANVNVRFCNRYTFAHLRDIIENIRLQCHLTEDDIDLQYHCSGEAYICTDLCELITESILEVQGFEPKLSCEGGISDGRFMISYCPIIEFGLSDATIHQKNEKVPLLHLEQLKNVYKSVITKYCASI